MDIVQFIEDHSPGKSEAGRMLGRLVDAVRDTGKAGTLTLVIKIEPDKAAPGKGLLISDEITAKLPKHERPVRKAWLTATGLVVDFDPDAPSLPGMAVTEAGKLVDEQDMAATAAHFLQHTTGIHFDPGAEGGPWQVTVAPEDAEVEEGAEAEEEAASAPLPEPPVLSVVPDPVEDEAPADVDLASPFSLAAPARKVKDQPQA